MAHRLLPANRVSNDMVSIDKLNLPISHQATQVRASPFLPQGSTRYGAPGVISPFPTTSPQNIRPVNFAEFLKGLTNCLGRRFDR
jgi:hypothetical protein